MANLDLDASISEFRTIGTDKAIKRTWKFENRGFGQAVNIKLRVDNLRDINSVATSLLISGSADFSTGNTKITNGQTYNGVNVAISRSGNDITITGLKLSAGTTYITLVFNAPDTTVSFGAVTYTGELELNGNTYLKVGSTIIIPITFASDVTEFPELQFKDGSTTIGRAIQVPETGKIYYVFVVVTIQNVALGNLKCALDEVTNSDGVSITLPEQTLPTTVIDTTVPNAPVITTQSITTNQNIIRIEGTAEAGSTVRLSRDKDSFTPVDTIVDDLGVWNIPEVTLVPYTNTFTATAIDVAGNISDASDSVTVTFDVVEPTIVSSTTNSQGEATKFNGRTIEFVLGGVENIFIWPNPTSGVLNITVDKKADYKLLNTKGQVLREGTLDAKEKKIDISSLSIGIYLLNLKTDKGSFIKKIVKN